MNISGNIEQRFPLFTAPWNEPINVLSSFFFPRLGGLTYVLWSLKPALVPATKRELIEPVQGEVLVND